MPGQVDAEDVDRCDDGRVVGRALPTARFLVDIAFQAAIRHSRAREYEIDTQPGIAAETCRTVIPPAEALCLLLEHAEAVVQAEFQQ